MMPLKLEALLRSYTSQPTAELPPRPPGCWCGGAGGEGIKHLPPIGDEDGPSIPFASRRYCDCPEGQAMRERAALAFEERRLWHERMVFERCWRGAGVPREWRDNTFDSFPLSPATAAALRLVRTWTETDSDSQPWLYLYGPVGTGKTGLAVAAMRSRLESGAVVGGMRFCAIPDLLDQLRPNHPGRDELFDALKSSPLLVLDDFGPEKVTAWAYERLYVLINHRFGDHLPTIFTSNLSLPELSRHLEHQVNTPLQGQLFDDVEQLPEAGPRIASRIMGKARLVELSGPDIRASKRGSA